jgi:hypothetical protein
MRRAVGRSPIGMEVGSDMRIRPAPTYTVLTEREYKALLQVEKTPLQYFVACPDSTPRT